MFDYALLSKVIVCIRLSKSYLTLTENIFAVSDLCLYKNPKPRPTSVMRQNDKSLKVINLGQHVRYAI